MNFQAQPKAFQTENAKVNYTMSFLKGMALDYFKPFLDTPDDKPDWLEDYKLFMRSSSSTLAHTMPLWMPRQNSMHSL